MQTAFLLAAASLVLSLGNAYAQEAGPESDGDAVTASDPGTTSDPPPGKATGEVPPRAKRPKPLPPIILPEAPIVLAPGGFATLDRMDSTSRAGAQVAYLSHKNLNVQLLRMELYGQFVRRVGVGHIGGYGHLPIVIALIADRSNEIALSNLEIGGFYVFDHDALSEVFRLGVVLPTATNGINDVLNSQTVAVRLNDFAAIFPDATWLRASVSPMVRTRTLFFRGDAGLDVPLALPAGLSLGPLLHLNIAAGVDTGSVAFAVELVTLTHLGDGGATTPAFVTGSFGHSFAVSMQVTSSNWRPSLTVVIPVDDALQPTLQPVLWAAMVGFEHAFVR